MGGNIVDAIDGGHEMSGHIFFIFFLSAKAEIDSFHCGIELHKTGSKRRLYRYLSDGIHEGQGSWNIKYLCLCHQEAQCKLLIEVHK